MAVMILLFYALRFLSFMIIINNTNKIDRFARRMKKIINPAPGVIKSSTIQINNESSV